ncbi:hypothetical protein EXIGLDRAFT_721631 [Exidia glandulosa HHB12029]|uniref:Family A G protein-coupled receptor-like protein n=1 Tax=Exidia glandulosa HHB12029 TaxID=1314781 RepID=A0A165FKK5_EXIGL|nr:hypothetical protein EXIGLDRAFT_721631 [Exidia glandulosa HHB12029]
MADSNSMRIPTPVGGTPMHIDGVPSILFAIAYGVLVPFIVARMFRPGNRSALLVGTSIYAIERVVVYSLRASQAYGATRNTSGGLLIYLQLSLAQGYITMAQDTVPLLRVMLVHATNPPVEDVIEPRHPEVKDNPRTDPTNKSKMRFWVRRAMDVLNLGFLAATVPNGVQGGKYKTALHNQEEADKLQRFRYASTAVTLLFMLIIGVWTLYAYFRIANVRRAAALRILTILALILPVPIYRFATMHFTIPDLLFTGPGSLESGSSKALFYVFHCLPEWATAALLVLPNTRKLFRTGAWGDWRGQDGQKGCVAARKEQREEKERKRLASVNVANGTGNPNMSSVV